MQDNDSAAEKRTVVDYLSFGSKTVKRVSWEAWEFTVVGPHLVEVTNASYGYLKDDHSYVVGVEERDGLAVPAECDCPADIHHDPDCKHKVALATVGGETVLNAAVSFETPAPASSGGNSKTAADLIKADGGTAVVDAGQQDEDACPNGNPRCDGPESDDLPCFACYCNREEAA